MPVPKPAKRQSVEVRIELAGAGDEFVVKLVDSSNDALISALHLPRDLVAAAVFATRPLTIECRSNGLVAVFDDRTGHDLRTVALTDLLVEAIDGLGSTEDDELAQLEAALEQSLLRVRQARSA